MTRGKRLSKLENVVIEKIYGMEAGELAGLVQIGEELQEELKGMTTDEVIERLEYYKQSFSEDSDSDPEGVASEHATEWIHFLQTGETDKPEWQNWNGEGYPPDFLEEFNELRQVVNASGWGA